MTGVGARVLLVGGDHEAARVGHGAAHLFEAHVGGSQDSGDPLALGVQRSAPGLLHHVLGERLAQAGADLVARAGTPGHLPRVGHEQDGTHDAVLEGVTIAVGVVRARTSDALLVLLVGDEGDRRGVGSEGRARQSQAARRVREGLAHAVAPREGIAGVVDLVEDDEGAVGAGARRVNGRVGADLRVGDGHAVEVRAGNALRVREVGVDVDAEARGARGPLALEVLGGAHNGELVDDAAGDQLGRERQGEGRLTCARGRDRQKIARRGRHVPARRAACQRVRAGSSRSLAGALSTVGEGPVTPILSHRIAQLLAGGAHRVLRGVAGGDPHLATQSDDGLARHHGRVRLILAHEVGEAVAVPAGALLAGLGTLQQAGRRRGGGTGGRGGAGGFVEGITHGDHCTCPGMLPTGGTRAPGAKKRRSQ